MSEVVVASPLTGEVVQLDTASDALIATLRVESETLALRLKQLDAAIQNEMRSRMDRAAEWTRHVVADGQRYKFTAPSPSAGAVEYDPDSLEIVLADLVESGTIDAEAAAKALQRTVTVVLGVPWGASVESVEQRASGLDDAVKVSSAVKVNLPTIAKLMKMPSSAGPIRAVGKHVAVPDENRRVKFEVEA
jgi:hypothetical protein